MTNFLSGRNVRLNDLCAEFVSLAQLGNGNHLISVEIRLPLTRSAGLRLFSSGLLYPSSPDGIWLRSRGPAVRIGRSTSVRRNPTKFLASQSSSREFRI